MTTIAWDGQTLAADKRSTSQGTIRTVTKIWKLSTGVLFGGSGDPAFILSMKDWVERGADPLHFPDHQSDKDDWQPCFSIGYDGKVNCWERTPYPIIFEDEFFTMGSGREYALGALHCGKSAEEAVAVACCFDSGSGNGIDTLTLGE